MLRHHAVHTEVNSHIGFENFLKAAAVKQEESVDIDTSSDDEPLLPGVPDTSEAEYASEKREIEINYENNIVEMNAMMRSPSLEITLPNFDICPIGPELPGESGSIRKVRDTERAKVDRRISGESRRLIGRLFGDISAADRTRHSHILDTYSLTK